MSKIIDSKNKIRLVSLVRGRSLLLAQVQIGLVVGLSWADREPVRHMRPCAHLQLRGNPLHRHQRLLPQARGDFHLVQTALGPFRQAGFLPPRSSVVNVSQEKNRMPPVCGLGVGVIA